MRSHSQDDDDAGEPPAPDRDDVVDLTGPGKYTFLNEGRDQRRYQLSWWYPAGVTVLVVAFVAAMVLLS